ncbi:MAG: group 1 glycosyl transferase [Acidimicrobiaceae bacterium]|nr:group 1 glycosyl transferase [Acidimicrobiaceae bacterium]
MPPRRRRRRDHLGAEPGPWDRRHIVICNWRDSTHPKAGGAEIYCERIAERFHAHGARVTLVTAGYRGAARRTETPFCTIVRMGNTFTVYPLALLWILLRLRRIDAVIDSQNGIPFFSPAVVRQRTPVALLIHHVHQHQFALYFPRWLTFIGRFLENQASSWVYGLRPVCVVSPSSRTEVRRQLSFRGPIFLVPCGQDATRNEAEVARSERPRIIYVGRFVRQKRLELLIRAIGEVVINEVPDMELHLVGDGEERIALERLVEELGLREQVVFHGKVSDARRDELVASSWLCVSPSVAEGWGMSIMEAAAYGVPALSLRVPGLQDTIEDGVTGWLADDKDDFGKAIVAALRTLEELTTAQVWANRCRARAQRFNWNATADRLLGILASERDRRLNPLLDRRESSDAATVVALERSFFPIEFLRRLRRQDQVRFASNTVALLLVGADEEGARSACIRIGLALDHVRSIRLARSADLIGWDLDAGAAELGFLQPLEADRGPLWTAS